MTWLDFPHPLAQVPAGQLPNPLGLGTGMDVVYNGRLGNLGRPLIPGMPGPAMPMGALGPGAPGGGLTGLSGALQAMRGGGMGSPFALGPGGGIPPSVAGPIPATATRAVLGALPPGGAPGLGAGAGAVGAGGGASAGSGAVGGVGSVGAAGAAGPAGSAGFTPMPPTMPPGSVTAGGAAQAGGVAGRLAGAVTNPNATGIMRYARPGLGLMGALRPIAGYGGAGMLASSVLNRIPGEGNVEQGLQGAAMGAGLGAAAGSIFPVVGTGLGALAGGAIGGAAGVLGNIFGGDEEGGDFEERLNTILDSANLPDEFTTQMQTMYEILAEAGGGTDEAKQQALAAVGQTILQQMQAQDQAAAAQEQMLAQQALTAQFFQPLTQQMLDSAQQRAAIGERIAADLPENYQGVARMQNAAALDNATRTANAYAAQAQLLPAMATMQYQMGLADQLAQQQAQQVMSQMGGGGQGATSLAALAGQLAGGGGATGSQADILAALGQQG